jgi:predicted HTH transcriptional regulator
MLLTQNEKRLREAKAERERVVVALDAASEVVRSLEKITKDLRRRLRAEESAERRATHVKTPLERAGRGNVEAVLKLIQRRPMTQAEVVERTGKNNGTITYAIRALTDDGLIRPTGYQENGSKEYEAVSRRRVTRPGDR